MKVDHAGSPITRGNESHTTESARHTKRGERSDSAQKARSARHTDETAETRSRGGAKLSISDRGREFAQAKAEASGAPDVRDSRIEEIKRQIAGGRYQMDADAIASRLVDDHMTMPG